MPPVLDDGARAAGAAVVLAAHGSRRPRPHVTAHETARLLSAYLCGTHSGVLARTSAGRRRGLPPRAVAAAHRALGTPDREAPLVAVARARWEPEEQAELERSLRGALAHPQIVDLILYGSQARGGRTGYSDVDAILVIADEAADEASALRSLRGCVLAAERAVLRYQPMQHHGFDVVTPRLLSMAGGLDLPAAALAEARSLSGSGVVGRLADDPARAGVRLRGMVGTLRGLTAWPAHPWQAHGVVSMFALLPTLYLQALGRSVPKWRSFAEARVQFPDEWWSYDVLAAVRARWPRRRYPALDLAASALRNPWAAVAVWRRLPQRLGEPVAALLTPELLAALQSVAGGMEARLP